MYVGTHGGLGQVPVRHGVIDVFNVGWVSLSVTHHNRRQGSRRIPGPRPEQTSSACRFGGLRA